MSSFILPYNSENTTGYNPYDQNTMRLKHYMSTMSDKDILEALELGLEAKRNRQMGNCSYEFNTGGR